MFKQPSVNQIASAYQGNPAPLAQKVQQDKQQNGGIPQDLRQLLALNDITQGRNAIGIQQALQAPAQMPTVAQSLQERARQAIQAQLMQQMQQQQAKEGQPGIVPPNTPRPPMQAQGIDNLPTNVGEQYARGGIIGFSEPTEENNNSLVKDESLLDRYGTAPKIAAAIGVPLWAYKQAADFLAVTGTNASVKEVATALAKQGVKNTASGAYNLGKTVVSAPGAAILAGGIPATQFTADVMKNNPKLRESYTENYMQGAMDPDNALGAAILNESAKTEDKKQKAIQAAAPDQSVVPYGQTKVNLSNVLSSENKSKSQPNRVNTETQSNVDNAPLPGGLSDLAALQSTGVGNKYLQDQLAKNQAFKPEDFKKKYLEEVGPKDLSIYDQTAEELKARKERLNNPQTGYDSLMEYLGQIAQGHGARNWMQAGAMGAANVNALQKQRQAEQDVLMDKILDLGAKKKEAQYNERLGMFNLTKAEQDRIIEKSTEIAGKLNLSEDKQKELTQNMMLEKMREKVKYDEMKNQRTVASIGAQDRDQLMNRAKALMAVDKTLSLEEAMKRAALAAGAASLENADVKKLAAFDNAKADLKKQYPEWSMPDTPEGRKVRERYDKELKDIKTQYNMTGGIDTLPSAAKPIPAGAGPNDLSVGTVYQTARGPAKWNGKAFDPVQ